MTTVTSIAHLPPASVAVLVSKADKAREAAVIHRLSCRYKARDLVCSTCHELDARAVRLAKLAGRVS